MKELVKKIPVIGPAARFVARNWGSAPSSAQQDAFPGSDAYWKQRYVTGGNSGAGSYSKFAHFKAEILNPFVKDKGIESVIEYGSGDGNQLTLADYPRYLGIDVSPEAVALCRKLFANDPTKSFKLTSDYSGEQADLTMSLDVIYHLTEDEVFHEYMARLFDSSQRFVAIYSSDTDALKDPAPHVRHRKFTAWVERNRPGWKLARRIPNKYPYQGNGQEGSFADFFIYEKSQ